MIRKYFPAMILAAAATAPAIAQQPHELLDEAGYAYMDYDFPEATRLLNLATKKAPRNDDAFRDRLDLLRARISTAKGFMERVERIEILDSIAVPRDGFFKAYRIPAASGSLGDGTALPVRGKDAGYVFTNENGDYKIWSMPDSTGNLTLAEASRLTDGSWGDPQPMPELSEEGNAAWPFMMADGVTLYYASDGPESIGGYDIMVATRDASDGSFLQPQNLGMPYNSPYDDYLMAIDEMNGVGWWATDRNQLDGLITVYLFKVNELRRNYDADDDDLVEKALLSDWRSTQDPDADYSGLLASIRDIQPGTVRRPAEISLPMDGGRTYRHYSDFRNADAAALMRRYMASKAELEKMALRLGNMRRNYHEDPSPGLGRQIADLEKQYQNQCGSLRRMLSDVYRAERSQK